MAKAIYQHKTQISVSDFTRTKPFHFEYKKKNSLRAQNHDSSLRIST